MDGGQGARRGRSRPDGYDRTIRSLVFNGLRLTVKPSKPSKPAKRAPKKSAAAPSLSAELEKSRQFEMTAYIEQMDGLYRTHLEQNGLLFDITARLTDQFQRVTAKSILEDSRVIKIYRYCVAPSISQMKFGQFFEVASTEPFEAEKLTGGAKLEQLKRLAPRIADFVNARLDRTRFAWLDTRLTKEEIALALRYARSWTCSLIADQNAQTSYRTWRKTAQENRIEQALIQLGYLKSGYRGDVTSKSDINVGSYSKERRVKGRTIQKADLVVHQRNGKRLILIEAKAIGVELDAYKRVKECCDKAGDWKSNPRLGSPLVAAVVAGFLTETNVRTLQAAGVHVIWEHDLGKISEIVG